MKNEMNSDGCRLTRPRHDMYAVSSGEISADM